MTDSFFDRQGNPIPLLQWGRLKEDPEYRTVAETEVGPDRILRTVWLGFVDDACCARNFGTAIISADPITVEVEQYDTEADARAGHRRHLDAIEAGHHCDTCRNRSPHP